MNPFKKKSLYQAGGYDQFHPSEHFSTKELREAESNRKIVLLSIMILAFLFFAGYIFGAWGPLKYTLAPIITSWAYISTMTLAGRFNRYGDSLKTAFVVFGFIVSFFATIVGVFASVAIIFLK